MKRLVRIIAVLLCFLVLLAGCKGAPKEEPPRPSEQASTVSRSAANATKAGKQVDPRMMDLYKDIYRSGKSVGIAYIGYVGAGTDEQHLRQAVKNSDYGKKYAFLCDAPYVDAKGSELYGVVTTKAEQRVTVCQASPQEDGTYKVQENKPFYEDTGMVCFLLRCNVSEIHSNVCIRITTGEQELSVYPMLSGADGSVAAAHCYDFSLPTGVCIQDDVQIAYDLLLEFEELQYYTDLGMTLQYTGETQVIDGRPCMVFALGTASQEQFVRERYYGVCDNLVYAYDQVTDDWYVLGKG